MLPSEIDGTLKPTSIDVEDLDGTGISQSMGKNLNAEKSKPVFMNLINIDEKAQVSTYFCQFEIFV